MIPRRTYAALAYVSFVALEDVAERFLFFPVNECKNFRVFRIKCAEGYTGYVNRCEQFLEGKRNRLGKIIYRGHAGLITSVLTSKSLMPLTEMKSFNFIFPLEP